jgi:alkylation response protein AidB-like acyl-CoA dehydrogenase
MEWPLNEHQILLRDSAVRLCVALGGTARARQLRTEGPDDAGWQRVVEAGWPGLLVAEADGGLGLGAMELVMLARELGRASARLPLAPALVAAWAVARGGLLPDLAASLTEGRQRAAPAIHGVHDGFTGRGAVPEARRAGDGWVIDGAHSLVPDIDGADLLLVATSGGLLGVVTPDAPGLTRTCHATLGEAAVSDLHFAATPFLPAARDAAGLVADMENLLLLATAAELLGLGEAGSAMTQEYLAIRRQFGRPIGSFQALQHRTVDGFIGLELVTSLVFRSAVAFDDGTCHPAMPVAAKAKAGSAVLAQMRGALQMHGAMGYTDEHDIGLLYKRALALSALYGNEAAQLARFATLTGAPA